MTSARNLDAATAANLQATHVACWPMVEMIFDTGTVRISGTDFDVEYPAGSGQMWLAARGLGGIETITETSESVEGLRFTLSGIPTSAIAEALQEQYQGRPCRVLMAFLDGDTVRVDETAWRGRLDFPQIDRSQQDTSATRSISVTAEHSLADWSRKRELLFNGASQLLIDPTDTFFIGIEASKQIEKVVFSKQARESYGY